MRRIVSLFSLFCGISMVLVWGFLLATRQVVELQTRPYEAGFLLGAEFITAISLTLSGFGVITGKKWGFTATLVALGMLLYCTVYSIGVFGQKGNTPATVFFIVVASMAAVFSASFILQSTKGGNK